MNSKELISRLPKTETEAVEMLRQGFIAHDINVDFFDTTQIIKAGHVVTLPELSPKNEHISLVERTKLFIAGAFAATRAKETQPTLSGMDNYYLDNPMYGRS